MGLPLALLFDAIFTSPINEYYRTSNLHGIYSFSSETYALNFWYVSDDPLLFARNLMMNLKGFFTSECMTLKTVHELKASTIFHYRAYKMYK